MKIIKPARTKNSAYLFILGIIEIIDGLFKIFTFGCYTLSLSIDYSYWYHKYRINKELKKEKESKKRGGDNERLIKD